MPLMETRTATESTQALLDNESFWLKITIFPHNRNYWLPMFSSNGHEGINYFRPAETVILSGKCYSHTPSFIGPFHTDMRVYSWIEHSLSFISLLKMYC